MTLSSLGRAIRRASPLMLSLAMMALIVRFATVGLAT
jgi:hypothetical protein